MPAEPVAELRLRLNDPLVVVGPPEHEWDNVEDLPGPTPATWDESYVVVRAEAQQAIVRVRLWRAEPVEATTGRRTVFDGHLDLPNGVVRVGDSRGLRGLVCLVAQPGRAHVVIWTDGTAFPTGIDVWVE
jgi:hypothetical protein